VVDVVFCAAKQKAGRQAGQLLLALIAIGLCHDLAMIALLQISQWEIAADRSSGSSENTCMVSISLRITSSWRFVNRPGKAQNKWKQKNNLYEHDYEF
jgi:hypothetical protein